MVPERYPVGLAAHYNHPATMNRGAFYLPSGLRSGGGAARLGVAEVGRHHSYPFQRRIRVDWSARSAAMLVPHVDYDKGIERHGDLLRGSRQRDLSKW